MRAAALTLALGLCFACGWLLSDQPQQARAQGKGKGGGGGGNVHCAIDSVTPVALGTYDPESATSTTGTGQLRFSCKGNQTLTLQITIGASGVSGSIADRVMRELGGSDELHYNLFQDQRGTVIWGDGVNGGSPAFVTGSKNFSVEIYGIAHPAQQVSQGIYADALRITILP
jgi:spore coat protein U-like protein